MLDLTKFDLYVCGGYIRDRLLKIEPRDCDYVVCGATPDIMLAAGFKKIEATSFPVFLHPVSKEEFALARTEKKTGKGYHGFSVNFDQSVTLEEDLFRRDLTCNSLAQRVTKMYDSGICELDNEVIDPYGGQYDIKKGILRHTSESTFKDDPLRLLRIARFQARYNFEIDKETQTLMKEMAVSGELEHLTPERVWLEFTKALNEDYPELFFHSLDDCGALSVLFPELYSNEVMCAPVHYLFKCGLRRKGAIPRLLSLFTFVPLKEAQTLCERLKVPLYEQRLIDGFIMFRKYVNHTSIPSSTRVLELYRHFRQHYNDIYEISDTFEVFDVASQMSMDIVLEGLREAHKVTFATLTKEQQTSLQGKDIGKALDSKRLEYIRKVVLS